MKYEIKYGFRIVHIENIPHIVNKGFVHYDSPDADPNFVPIGDKVVIEKRKSETQGFKLDKFIPFYLGPRSPMLFVIQHGFNGVQQIHPEDIIYCVIKISDIIANKIKCFYTDGHALDKLTTFYPDSELTLLDSRVNYDDVYTRYWISQEDRDLKRRKEAELLLVNDLPPEYICGFVVYNENAQQRLLAMGIPLNKICINSNYYF